MMAADVRLTQFTADGQDWLVEYEVSKEFSAAFSIDVYQSFDGSSPHALLERRWVTSSADLTVGTHAQIIQPRFTDAAIDYALVVDINLTETELSPTSSPLRFAGGVFQTGDGTVHVHGGNRAGEVAVSKLGTLGVTVDGVLVPKVFPGDAEIKVRGLDTKPVLYVPPTVAQQTDVYSGRRETKANHIDPNLAVTGFSASASLNWVVDYQVSGAASEPFAIGIYRSADGVKPDALLMRYRIDEPNLLGVGAHRAEISPDFSDLDQTYTLLAIADPEQELWETNETDNQRAFAGGIFKSQNNFVHVHGTAGPDRFRVTQASTVDVTWNGNTVALPVAEVALVRVRGQGGSDQLERSVTMSIGAETFGKDELTPRSPATGLDLLPFPTRTPLKGGSGVVVMYSGGGNGGLSDTRLFDFNGSNGYTQSGGYESVSYNKRYGNGTDPTFGWTADPGAFERGGVAGDFADLRRDAHFNTNTGSNDNGASTFRVDLPAGDYFVSLTSGDQTNARDNLQVKANGNIVIADLDTDAAWYARASFTVTVAENIPLSLEFRDLGGGTSWVVNSVEIRPAEEVLAALTLSGPAGSPDADGLTIDTYSGTGASPNSFLTVTTSAGTITSTDLGADNTRPYNGVQIQADGGGNFTFSLQRPTGAGNVTVIAEELSGLKQGTTSTAFVAPATRRFDLATAAIDVETGYVGVWPTDTYTSARGFGWTATMGCFTRSGNAPLLLRSLHYNNVPSTFVVDVPNGTYFVTVGIGDLQAARTRQDVYAEGALVLDEVSTPFGNITHRTFSTTVSDGNLTLEFLKDGGGDVTIASIELRTSQANDISIAGPTGNLTADGMSSDEFTVTAPANMLVTLDTTLGAISGIADASSYYTGLQILGNGNPIPFNIWRPANPGTTTVTAEEVTGATIGTRSQTYVFPTTRRFDFNNGAGPVQSGYLGVNALTQYGNAATPYYGWTNASGVGSADRNFTTPAGATTQVDLLRDFNYGSTNATGNATVVNASAEANARTFRTSGLIPNTAYFVTATVGDSATARSDIEFSAGGNNPTIAVADVDVAVGEFKHVTFTSTSDANGDLFIKVKKTSGGGAWVINGLEIRPTQNEISLSGPAGPLLLTGATDTFTGNGASPNSFVSVSSTLGNITSSDAHSRYSVVQVQADGNGAFVFALQRPSVSGLATIKAEEVNGAALGTITREYGYALSIGNAAVTEGNSGTQNAVFTVSLSGNSSQTVTVQYAAGNATAVAGSDFTATSGTLTFSPGQTSKTVTVSVLGDTLDEDDTETFDVTLSNAGNAFILQPVGIGAINDDDAAPTVSLGNLTLAEGNSGVVNAVFSVALSAVSGRTITVPFSTSDGSAIAASDYVAQSGTLTFSPGQANQTITVEVHGDTFFEGNESFSLTLDTPVNASLGQAVGVATITNDDVPPSVTLDAPGTAGEGANLTITGTPNHFNDANFTFAWGVTRGNNSVASGNSGSISFIPADDGNYTVTLTLSNSLGESAAQSASISVTNVAPTANAGGPYTLNEGASATLAGSFTDPGADDTHGLVWDLDGDGIFGETDSGASRGIETSLSPSFSAAAVNGPATSTVTFRVTDDDGGSHGATALVTIVNVAPSADAGGPYDVDEGATIELSGTGVDPIDAVTFEWDLDGDAIFGETGASASSGEELGAAAIFNAAWLSSPDTRTITLRVLDSEGASSTSTATVEIQNAPPAANAGGPYSANEGGTVGLSGTGSDLSGAVTLSWDLDGDGEFGNITSARGNEALASPVWNAASINGPTTRVVTLRVYDVNGASTTSTAQISIANVAPSANAGGPYSVNEGNTIALSGSGSDPVDSLVFKWDLDGDGAFGETDAAALYGIETGASPVFSAGVSGNATLTLQLRVSDPDGAVTSSSTTLQVINVAPTANAGGSYTVDEGGTIGLSGTGSDPVDNLFVEWDLDGDGVFGELDSAYGNESLANPVFNAASLNNPVSLTVTVRVTDVDGAVDTSITVVAVRNTSPQANAGGSYTVTENGTVGITGLGSDAKDEVTLLWDLDGDGTFGETGSEASRGEEVGNSTIFNATGLNGPGTRTITLLVSEPGDDSSAVSTALIDIRNVAPIASTTGPYSVDEGATVLLSGSATDALDSVTLLWDLDSDSTFGETGGSAANGNETGVAPTFSAVAVSGPTTKTIWLQATDGDGGTTQQSTTVTISNVAPTANAGGPYTVDEGGSVDLSATGHDPVDAVTFHWDLDGDGTFGESDADASGGDETGFAPTFNAAHVNGPETVTVTLRVIDADGASATSTAVVQVANLAPQISTMSPYTVPEGGTVGLQASISDFSGDVWTAHWDLDGDGAFGEVDGFGARGDETGATPTYNAAGQNGDAAATVTLRVTDSDGASATSTTLVAILNASPTANAQGPYTVAEGSATELEGLGADPIDTITMAWDLDGDGAFGEVDGFGARGDETGATPTYNAAGQNGDAAATVTLRVTDSDGASATSTTLVTILNASPTANAQGPYTVAEGSATELEGSGADPIDTITMAWDLDGDGTFGEVDGFGARGDETGATPTYNAAGQNGDAAATVTLRVTDSDGASAMSTTLVTILNVAPLINIANHFTVAEGGTQSLSANATDPGQDALTFEWDLDGDGTYGETGGAAAYGDEWGSSVTFNAAHLDGPSALTIGLKVTDSDGASTLTNPDLDVVVNNVMPTPIPGGPYTVAEGSSTTLIGSGTDPIDTLTITWDLDGDNTFGSSSTAYGNEAIATTSFNAANLDGNGVHWVTLRVDDGDDSVTTAVPITIVNVAPAPTISGATSPLGAGVPIHLTGAPNDPGISDTFTYQWSVTKNGAAFTTGPDSPAFDFTPDDAGEFVVTLTITDDDQGVGSTSSTIRVVPGVIVDDVEVNEGAGFATFTISRNGGLDTTVVVHYETADGNATLVDDDYVQRSGSVTLTAGVATVTVTVAVVDDPTTESDETFLVQLTDLDVVGPPVQLGAEQQFTLRSGTVALASGDFDGDDDVDLATISYGSGNVSIFQNASGILALADEIAVGSGPIALATADFDGDGNDDIVVVNQLSSNLVILMGPDLIPHDIALDNAPFAVATGDLNGDGNRDLAVASFDTGNLTLLLGSGNGDFNMASSHPTLPGGARPSDLTLADLNGDSWLDLAVTNHGLNSVSIFLNDETGAFNAPTIVDVGNGPTALAVADLNADGRVDLVVTNMNSDSVSVLTHPSEISSVSFSRQDLTVGDSPTSVAIGDLNGDGKPDLAVTNLGSNTVSMLRNITLSDIPTFAERQDRLFNNDPVSLVIANFDPDPDARPDLAVARTNPALPFQLNDSLSILTNNTPPSAEIVIADDTGIGTIVDNELPVTISIGNATVIETEGNQTAVFPVTLSRASDEAIVVSYATVDETAIAGLDYFAKNSASPNTPLTFAPGETQKFLTVVVQGDTLDEDPETFHVTLDSTTTVAVNHGVATIYDNDPEPIVTLSSSWDSLNETTTSAITFTATLSARSSKPVVVELAFSGSAVLGEDYQISTQTLSIAPGNLTVNIPATIHALADTLHEGNETFLVSIGDVTNATMIGSQAVPVTIVDNDAVPQLSIANSTVIESSFDVVAAVFTVTLNAASSQVVTVNYESANGSTNPAVAPTDYQQQNGVLTFAPGETSKTITIDVNGDLVIEGNEQFVVNLFTPIHATISIGSGLGTITDDDADLAITAFATSNSSDWKVNYTIEGSTAQPFDISVYRTGDDEEPVLLGSVRVAEPEFLTPGAHTRVLPPHFTDVYEDYVLFAGLDAEDEISESNELNNVQAFSGGIFRSVNSSGDVVVHVHGTPGDDTVDISQTATAFNVSLNDQIGQFVPPASVSAIHIRLHDGNDTIASVNTDTPQSVWGGAGDDRLLSGTGDDHLFGGTGNDAFAFTDDSAGNDSIHETIGEGADVLDFSAVTTSVTVDLSLTDEDTPGSAQQTVFFGQTIALISAYGVSDVIGGAGDDSLTGNDGSNVVTGGPGNDTLTGGEGDDAYYFAGTGALGNDTVVEEEYLDNDTLDFSGLNVPITIDLGNLTLQTVTSDPEVTLGLTLSSATGIEAAVGTMLGDSITGNDRDNILYSGPGDDTLAGGGGDDIYIFEGDASLGTDTIVETADGGIDTLDFSGLAGPITLDLTYNNAVTPQAVNGLLSLHFADALGNVHLENVVGTTGDDHLKGNALDNLLAGGLGNDTYIFRGSSSLGNDTLIEEADVDHDTLDFSGMADGVIGNLSVTMPQVVNSRVTLNLSGNTAFEGLIGSDFHDILTGNSRDNVFDGRDGNDTLSGLAGNDTYRYSGLVQSAGCMTVATVVNGAVAIAGVQERQDFTLGSADGGTFTVNGSDPIPFNADAATIETAMQAILGSVVIDVADLSAGSFSVTWQDFGDQFPLVFDFDNLYVSSPVDSPLASTVTDGIDAQASIQEVTLSGATTGTWTIGSQTLNFDASTTEVETAIEAEYAEAVEVSSPSAGVWTVTWVNPGVATVLNDLTEDTDGDISSSVLQEGIDSAPETQSITWNSSADAGDFTLVDPSNSSNTVAVAFDADAAELQDAFDTLLGAGVIEVDSLSVTGNYVFSWLAGGNQPQLDVSFALERHEPVTDSSHSTYVDGAGPVPAVHEVQTITLDEHPNGGAFSILVEGVTTLDIPWDISGTEFEALFSSYGNVSGEAGGPWTLTWNDDQDHGEVSIVANTLVREPRFGLDEIIEAANQDVDTLDFTGLDQAISVNLASTSDQEVSAGWLTLSLSDATGLENVIGTAYDDQITGNARNNLLVGGSGADQLTGGDGDDQLIGGVGNDELTGGGGNDTYFFAGSDDLGNDTIFEDATVDSDTLDFTSLGGSVELNLAVSGTDQVVSPSLLTLQLSSDIGIENVRGSLNSANLIAGNARDNVLTGGAADDTLAGGLGDDTYVFIGDVWIGSDTIDEDDGLGNDTLDFSGLIGNLTLDIGNSTSQQIVATGVYYLTLTTAGGIENVIGTAGDDVITGNRRDNWLTGGAGNDTYRFGGDQWLGNDTIVEADDLDGDTFDFSTLDLSAFPSGINLDLGNTTPQDLALLTLTLIDPAGVENVIGTAENDTITGNLRDNTLTGGPGNDILTGLEGSDTYRFAGSGLGVDTINEAADVDSDTLDFSEFGSAITINLGITGSPEEPQVIADGELSIVLSSETGIENVIGTSFSDKITGNSRDNYFSGGFGADEYWFHGNLTFGFDSLIDENYATIYVDGLHSPVAFDSALAGFQEIGLGYLENLGIGTLIDLEQNHAPIPVSEIMREVEENSSFSISLEELFFDIDAASEFTSLLIDELAFGDEALIDDIQVVGHTLVITPVQYMYGYSTITVTVSNGDGLFATNSFVLIVTPENHAPLRTAEDIDTPEPINVYPLPTAPHVYDIWNYFTDAKDGTYLNYSVDTDAPWLFRENASPTVDANGFLSLEYSGLPGTATLTITARDREGVEADEALTFSVTTTVPTSEVSVFGGDLCLVDGVLGSFTLSRTGPFVQDIAVAYTLSGATLDIGDFVAYFTAGAPTAEVVFTISPDAIAGDTISISLSDDSDPSYNIGSPGQAIVTLVESSPSTPTTPISIAVTQSEEAGGNGTFTFTREDTATELTVAYVLTGSAIVNVDFNGIQSQGDIHFAVGVSEVTITIVPIDDGKIEGDESIEIALMNGGGGCDCGCSAPNSASMVLKDDDFVTVDLVLQGWTEEQEDSPGVLLLVNSAQDEMNTGPGISQTPQGNVVASVVRLQDYQADRGLYHRITPDDSDLIHAILDIRQPSGEPLFGIIQWVIPEHVRVLWEKLGRWVEVESGPYFAGDPRDLRVEGITSGSGDIKVQFTPAAGDMGSDMVLARVANPPELAVKTIRHNSPAGELPRKDMMTPGAYVPFNNDDDNYNDKPDYTEGNTTVLTEDDLLPIQIKSNAALAGSEFRLRFDDTKYKIWSTPNRSGTPIVVSEYPIADDDPRFTWNNNVLTLYVEALTESDRSTIELDWISPTGDFRLRLDEFRIKTIAMWGPLNVPEKVTYSYYATGIFDRNEAKWLRSAVGGTVILSSEGTFVNASFLHTKPKLAEIAWGQGPHEGRAAFQVDSNYTWDLRVNVVQIGVRYDKIAPQTSASNLEFTPRGQRYSSDNNAGNLFATDDDVPVGGSLEYAMHATVRVGELKGPSIDTNGDGVGDQVRGVTFMEMGLIQNVRPKQFRAYYNDGTMRKHKEETNKPILDQDIVVAVSGPWFAKDTYYFKDPVNGKIPGRENTWKSPWDQNYDHDVPYNFFMADTPKMEFSDVAVNQKGAPIVRSVLEFDYTLSFAVHTLDLRANFETNLQKELYAELAVAKWWANGNSTFSNSTSGHWNGWTPALPLNKVVGGDTEFRTGSYKAVEISKPPAANTVLFRPVGENKWI